jgi:uncharacterized protein
MSDAAATGRIETPRLHAGHVLGFLAFSHGWTWAFWALAASRGTSIWVWPAVAFFYIGGAGVVLGGVVMSRVVHGRLAWRDLARRIFDPRLARARWWVVILLLYPLLACAAALLALGFGATQQPLDLSGALARLTDPRGLLIMAGFILLIGPLPEEIGWRGYLQDRLQTRWSALAAATLIGVLWWSWHLPLTVLPGYYDAFVREPITSLAMLVNIIPAAVLYAWVYNNTERSILAVIVLHFMENFTSEFLGFAAAARPYRLALMVALALVVVAWFGPRTLRRRAIAVPAPAQGD